MLKKGIFRRITVATLALVILVITYLFPTKIENEEFKENLNYSNIHKNAIYILNEKNLISRVNVVFKENDDIKKIKEIINYLTIKSSESEYIPTSFYAIIPSNTKINDVTLENGLLKIDFSNEFLNVKEENERKMIEAIIYSLTELDNVDKILIFINGVQLTELPNSHEKLPTILTKDFGVNKIYDIDNIKDTKATTIYYGSKTKDVSYYIPITYITNSKQEKVEIIIEKLKSSPIYESNLISYLNANAEITDYQLLEDEIKLSFNEYLLDDLDSDIITEEVQYTIYLSIRDTYNVNKVEFDIKKNDKNVNLVINSLE